MNRIILGILILSGFAFAKTTKNRKFNADLVPGRCEMIDTIAITGDPDTIAIDDTLAKKNSIYGIVYKLKTETINTSDACTLIIHGLCADTLIDTIIHTSAGVIWSDSTTYKKVYQVICHGARVDTDSVYITAYATNINIGEADAPFDSGWIDHLTGNATTSDTTTYAETSYMGKLIGGGMSAYKFTTAINVHSSVPYLVIDNNHSAGDSMLIYISSTGKGDPEKIKIAMPDSVILTAGTARTMQENFVYLHYNGGIPDWMVSAVQLEYTGTGAILDSLVSVGSYGLGEASASSVQIRKYNDYRNTLNKFLVKSVHRDRWKPQYVSGIDPTIRAKSIAFSSGGFAIQAKHLPVPAYDNQDGDQIVVYAHPDSNFSHFDSLPISNGKYSDGVAIGVNDEYWVVFWLEVSEDTTKTILYANIQASTTTYKKVVLCEQDEGKMIPTTIPSDFTEEGILLYAVIMTNDGDSTCFLADGSKYKNLRGLPSGTLGGGGIPATDSTAVFDWTKNTFVRSDTSDSALGKKYIFTDTVSIGKISSQFSDDPFWALSPDNFRQLPVNEWYEHNFFVPQKIDKGAVVITTDDGNSTLYDSLFTDFKSRGLVATHSIIVGNIGVVGAMSKAQIDSFYKYGHEIASHSMTHPDSFPWLSDSAYEVELKDSRDSLITLGYNPLFFVTPGNVNWSPAQSKILYTHLDTLIRRYYWGHRWMQRVWGNTLGSSITPLPLERYRMFPYSTSVFKDVIHLMKMAKREKRCMLYFFHNAEHLGTVDSFRMVLDTIKAYVDSGWIENLTLTQATLRYVEDDGNLISNGGFERGLWHGDTTIGRIDSVFLDSSVYYTGRYSLRIAHPGRVSQRIRVIPNEKYLFRLAVKGDSLAKANGNDVRFELLYLKDSTVVEQLRSGVALDTVWKTQTLFFTADSSLLGGGATVCLRIRNIAGSINVWYDNITLSRYGSSLEQGEESIYGDLRVFGDVEVDGNIVADTIKGHITEKVDSSVVSDTAINAIHADTSDYADNSGTIQGKDTTALKDSLYVFNTDTWGSSGWVWNTDTIPRDTTGGGGAAGSSWVSISTDFINPNDSTFVKITDELRLENDLKVQNTDVDTFRILDENDTIFVNVTKTSVSLGYGASQTAPNALFNVSIGCLTGRDNAVGGGNIYIGHKVGYLRTGHNNVGIGSQSMYTASAKSYNTAIGFYSMFTSDCYEDVSIGAYSGFNSRGQSNVSVGCYAGYQLNVSYFNTLIGFRAGFAVKADFANTMLGAYAGYTNTADSSVFVGYFAGYHETSGCRLYIANDSTRTPLIYGEFDTEYLKVNGHSYIRFATGYHLGADSIVISVSTDTIASPSTGFCFIDTTGGDTMKVFLNSSWEVK